MKTWDEAYEAIKTDLEKRKSVRRFRKGIKKRSGLTGDRNQCPHCGEFFNSAHAYVKHRVGSLKERRCLTIPEMLDKGFAVNDDLYWVSAVMQGEIYTQESKIHSTVEAK